jgi:hypothetical protein
MDEFTISLAPSLRKRASKYGITWLLSYELDGMIFRPLWLIMLATIVRNTVAMVHINSGPEDKDRAVW